MKLTLADLRKLALPALLAIAVTGLGAGLIWFAQNTLTAEIAGYAAAKNERTLARDKLARISQEEREVKEKVEVYRRLRELNILGKERRLEWIDTIQRIRTGREMLDVRYRIDPQKLLVSLPGKPGNVDFNVSAMKVELALLHEGDLLGFLADLRNAGNAYVSVRQCIVQKAANSPPPGSPSLAPRLRAECQIDLITVIDAGAKT